MNIGIIGHGFVGKAVSSFYGTDLFYDKFNISKTFEEVCEKSDCVFVCVPTDGRDNGYDYAPLIETFEKLEAIEYSKPVLMKSTVEPGKTDEFAEKYSLLELYFNPEFLDQATAKNDFARPKNPPCHILGVPKKGNYEKAMILGGTIFKNFDVPTRVVSASTAEMFKLATNAFYTTRVIFANQVYDLCEKFGANYDFIADLWRQIPRIGFHGYDVFHGGFRGAGGYCLPKDLNSLILAAEEIGVAVPLLKAVQDVNENFLYKAGKRIHSQLDVKKEIQKEQPPVFKKEKPFVL